MPGWRRAARAVGVVSDDDSLGLEVRGFESKLVDAMRRWHDCRCDVCHGMQGDLCHATLISWLMVVEPAQSVWLQTHHDDDHGRFLRGLLEAAAADGRDLAGMKATLEGWRSP